MEIFDYIHKLLTTYLNFEYFTSRVFNIKEYVYKYQNINIIIRLEHECFIISMNNYKEIKIYDYDDIDKLTFILSKCENSDILKKMRLLKIKNLNINE